MKDILLSKHDQRCLLSHSVFILCFASTVSLQSAITLSILTISIKAVFLTAVMCPTQLWSAQVCRLMLLPVRSLAFVCTGGTTPRSVVSPPSVYYCHSWSQWNHKRHIFPEFNTHSIVFSTFYCTQYEDQVYILYLDNGTPLPPMLQKSSQNSPDTGIAILICDIIMNKCLIGEWSCSIEVPPDPIASGCFTAEQLFSISISWLSYVPLANRNPNVSVSNVILYEDITFHYITILWTKKNLIEKNLIWPVLWHLLNSHPIT